MVSAGKVPFNLLLLKRRSNKLERLPISGGMVPLKEFESKRNSTKRVFFQRPSGIVELNLLVCAWNFLKFRFSISRGIAPVKRFSYMNRSSEMEIVTRKPVRFM